MLVGLVAVAIPVVVHFVGRRPPRVVLLPTARFAEDAQAGRRGRSLLRRILLLLARVAVVALLVLALAGPRVGGEASVKPAAGATGGLSASAGDQKTLADKPPVPPVPIKVLVVDAADEKDAKVRSADMVAAALEGDTVRPKIVQRQTWTGKIVSSNADVVFWIGPSYDQQLQLEGLAGDESLKGFVWLPAAPDPTNGPAPKEACIEEMPGGMTIDPNGYTSVLLDAFECGTSGDLGASVFCRRVILGNRRGHLNFRDGRPAAIVSGVGRKDPGQLVLVVRLAFGPAPAWGDMGNRPEFVVLINSLAEALGPKPNAAAPAAVYHAEPIKIEAPPAPRGTDLAVWFVLGLAAMLVVEGLLAAPRRAA